jgi:hypothetical protein
VLFLVLLASLHALKPEIDPSWRFISEYAIGRHGWMMSLAFLSLAAACVGAVIALWSQVRLGGRIGLGFLLVGAVGLTLAGIFTTDPITTPLDAQSTSSQLHGLGAILGDGILLGAIILTISLARNPVWRSARWMLVAVLLLVAIAYVWLIVSIPADGQFGPGVTVGWPSRLLIVSYGLWVLTSVWQALRLRKGDAHG